MSLKKHTYCILNQPYSKAEYQALVPRIVSHMRSTGEWGEFFPPSLSPFAYNETKASDWFPLTNAEILARGGRYRSEESSVAPNTTLFDAAIFELPISNVDNQILSGALTCQTSGKPFKIMPLELDFYRRKELRLPRKSPRVRHRERLSHLASRKLFQRFCESCGTEIRTSYSPEEREMVYCSQCYQAALV
jgi:CxxC-x17-CxxC domain-containing protein